MLVWVVITACVAENCCDDVEGDEVDAVVNAVDGVVATDTVVATAAVAAAIKLCIRVKFTRDIIKPFDEFIPDAVFVVGVALATAVAFSLAI